MSESRPIPMSAIIRIHPADNVGVARLTMKAGSCEGGILLRQDIPAGHKVALVGIPGGGMIRKYGFPIARATRPITAGEHVHSHNAATMLGADNVSVQDLLSPAISTAQGPIPTFQGFRRPDGRVAIRNEIWIINTVGCVNVPSQRIAEKAARRWVTPGSSIDGIHAFAHSYGCSQLGGDLENTRKLLASLARHPNAAAVLVLGLGCENNTLQSFLEEVGDFDPNRIRFLRHNEPVSENPSPGNKEGGITTLEEKSLGCIQKGGTAPIRHIGRYGDCAPRKLGGLSLIEGPGNDGVSSTALAAAGAHAILFTTGRGTPLGVPVPTLKISTNSDLARRKPKWIDFDAGKLLDPEGSDPVEDLMALVLDVASGQPARNEINGFREIAIWKQGVTL